MSFRYSGQVYDIRQLIVFTNRMYLSCECVHPSVYLLMSFVELIPANWQPKSGVAEWKGSAKKLRKYKQREARRTVAINPMRSTNSTKSNQARSTSPYSLYTNVYYIYNII